jgi:hypothetical protein
MRFSSEWRRTTACAAFGLALAASGATAAGPAAAPAPAVTPVAEVRSDFTYGPLRFRIESLVLDGSVSAHAKISIENLSRSIARVVLAATAATRNGKGLELTSAAGAKCDATEKDIASIKIVDSEGETKVKTMTPIQPQAKLVFSAKFHCNTGRLSTTDTLGLKGRILTATEAGGFDIPLNFTGLKASAK